MRLVGLLYLLLLLSLAPNVQSAVGADWVVERQGGAPVLKMLVARPQGKQVGLGSFFETAIFRNVRITGK